MFMPHSYPWGMPPPHPVHQTPGFPYNMGAIPEVVPGMTKGGHAAMATQNSARSAAATQQMPHPGMSMGMMSAPSMPVHIHPGMMMGYDPRMAMMGHPGMMSPGMMSPYGMHPGMMAQGGEGSDSSTASEPASPLPQITKSSRKNQSVRFDTQHMGMPHTPPQLAPSRGSFRYPGPPGGSGPSTAFASPASSALPTPSTHSYPTQGGYFTFVPYGTGSAQPSPTRATGSYPSTPAAYNAKADPFAMQAMAGQMRDDSAGGQETQRPALSDARYGRSWYGGR